jgi:hypothetical protein
MMYVVRVEQKALRANSDPMEASTALKVAKAWQSHGDRGVRIVATGDGASSDQSWSISEFIAFLRGAAPSRPREDETVRNAAAR